MSNNSVPSIEILPVELLHQIFAHLDAETIFLSLRLTCRLFRSIINNYDRYNLDLKLISKSNFYQLCRLIDPKNVISLTLSNDERTSNQIQLFISLVRLPQFTRLRSLTLLQIDEEQLNLLLREMNLSFLQSFSFSIRKYNDIYKPTNVNRFSSIIAQSSLHNLEFDISGDRMLKSLWSSNCSIQYLKIKSYVDTNNLNHILQCCPHLRTLVMYRFPTLVSNNLTLINFQQLTSLTIEELYDTPIDKVESFLSLTSSLTYLQLVGGVKMMDGKRWEKFIERNLSQLIKFDFYFSECRSTMSTPTHVTLIIHSFQTPFWIEYKKWFVTCEYLTNHQSIYVSSLPFCKCSLYYVSKSEKISLSTYPMMTNDGLSMVDKINSLSLILNKSTADDIQQNIATTTHPLFRNVTNIDLEINKDWSFVILQSPCTFIDISKIISLKIRTDLLNEYNKNIWLAIGLFMEQAHNLSSLIIERIVCQYIVHPMTENIYLNLPRHVKHLQIPINDLNQIEMILERCENLSTIKLYCENSVLSINVSNWFAGNTIHTTCQTDNRTTLVWLGKKKKR